MKLTRIPAGTFQMGSTEGQPDEQPVHEVAITEPFYMGIYEVTQAQWETLMNQNPSYFQGPRRPVDSVSWHQAQAFIDRLNEEENTDLYRLPTEAEWEYAARGGTNTQYYFGQQHDSLSAHAWYGFNSESQSHWVGKKRSNPFGLHDVYGNVWEWIHDAYAPNFYEHSPRANPTNTGSGSVPRVIRGGGWRGVGVTLRSANRGWARPNVRHPQLGFRVVREIPEEDQ